MAAAVATLAAACANPDRLMTGTETDALVTTAVTAEADPMGFVDRGQVDDEFPLAVVEVSGRTWVVAWADEPSERNQGLRRVADLGDLNGMLFVWDEDTTSTFGMYTVPIPLDIAWFDADGALVDRATMAPCSTEPCPSYRASGPYRYAVETVVGGFDGLEPLTLAVDP